MQIVFKHRLVCGMHINGLENEIWYLGVYLPSIFLFNINFLNAWFCNASSIFIVFSVHSSNSVNSYNFIKINYFKYCKHKVILCMVASEWSI